MSDEQGVITASGQEVADILKGAVVMPPVMAIGAHVFTDVNPNLAHDEVVTTVELLVLTPGASGDQMAIFTIIMDPELGASIGLTDTTHEEEEV